MVSKKVFSNCWQKNQFSSSKISQIGLKFEPDNVLNNFWKFTTGIFEILILEQDMVRVPEKNPEVHHKLLILNFCT